MVPRPVGQQLRLRLRRWLGREGVNGGERVENGRPREVAVVTCLKAKHVPHARGRVLGNEELYRVGQEYRGPDVGRRVRKRVACTCRLALCSRWSGCTWPLVSVLVVIACGWAHSRESGRYRSCSETQTKSELASMRSSARFYVPRLMRFGSHSCVAGSMPVTHKRRASENLIW